MIDDKYVRVEDEQLGNDQRIPFRRNSYHELGERNTASNEANENDENDEDTVFAWLYRYGPFSFTTISRLSKGLAKWGLIPLGASVILGILFLCNVTISEDFAKLILMPTAAVYGWSFLIFLQEQSFLREVRNQGKEKRNLLGLGSMIGFQGFFGVILGAVDSTDWGIGSEIIVFIGSAMTLAGFLLFNSDKRETGRKLRIALMWLIGLPAAISLFAFIGMVFVFIGRVISFFG